jgi:hypothetical protein
MSVNLGQHGAVAMSHELGDGQVVVALDKLTRREAMPCIVHGLTEAHDAALALLEDAARACHARLGLAMGTLRNTVAEIVETMETQAARVFADLSTKAHVRRAGIDPDALQPFGPPSKGAPVRFVPSYSGVSDLGALAIWACARRSR